MTVTPYERPEVTEEEQETLAMFIKSFFRADRRRQAGALAIILVEVTRLLKEVNEHRTARGYKPLDVFKPKI